MVPLKTGHSTVLLSCLSGHPGSAGWLHPNFCLLRRLAVNVELFGFLDCRARFGHDPICLKSCHLCRYFTFLGRFLIPYIHVALIARLELCGQFLHLDFYLILSLLRMLNKDLRVLIAFILVQNAGVLHEFELLLHLTDQVIQGRHLPLAHRCLFLLVHRRRVRAASRRRLELLLERRTIV